MAAPDATDCPPIMTSATPGGITIWAVLVVHLGSGHPASVGCAGRQPSRVCAPKGPFAGAWRGPPDPLFSGLGNWRPRGHGRPTPGNLAAPPDCGPTTPQCRFAGHDRASHHRRFGGYLPASRPGRLPGLKGCRRPARERSRRRSNPCSARHPASPTATSGKSLTRRDGSARAWPVQHGVGFFRSVPK